MFDGFCIPLSHKGMVNDNLIPMVEMHKKQWYFIKIAINNRIKCGIAKRQEGFSPFKTYNK